MQQDISLNLLLLLLDLDLNTCLEALRTAVVRMEVVLAVVVVVAIIPHLHQMQTVDQDSGVEQQQVVSLVTCLDLETMQTTMDMVEVPVGETGVPITETPAVLPGEETPVPPGEETPGQVARLVRHPLLVLEQPQDLVEQREDNFSEKNHTETLKILFLCKNSIFLISPFNDLS